jgi:hypothetical protein
LDILHFLFSLSPYLPPTLPSPLSHASTSPSSHPGSAVTNNFCTVNLCLSLQYNLQNISFHNARQLLWSVVFWLEHYFNMDQGKLLRISLPVRITAHIWFKDGQDYRTTGFWSWRGLPNGNILQ